MSAEVVRLELYVPHVAEKQRCTECGRLQSIIRPAQQDKIPYSECMFCHEMACEAVAPSVPFPMPRGKSVYETARAMGLKVT